jgi:hypothetical protein
VAQGDVGVVGTGDGVAGDHVAAAGRGRPEQADPDVVGPVHGVAGEAVGRPAALEQDREAAEEVQPQAGDPVAVDPVAVGAGGQVDTAPGEEGHRPVGDGDVVVATVLDPHLVVRVVSCVTVSPHCRG